MQIVCIETCSPSDEHPASFQLLAVDTFISDSDTVTAPFREHVTFASPGSRRENHELVCSAAGTKVRQLMPMMFAGRMRVIPKPDSRYSFWVDYGLHNGATAMRVGDDEQQLRRVLFAG